MKGRGGSWRSPQVQEASAASDLCSHQRRTWEGLRCWTPSSAAWARWRQPAPPSWPSVGPQRHSSWEQTASRRGHGNINSFFQVGITERLQIISILSVCFWLNKTGGRTWVWNLQLRNFWINFKLFQEWNKKFWSHLIILLEKRSGCWTSGGDKLSGLCSQSLLTAA